MKNAMARMYTHLLESYDKLRQENERLRDIIALLMANRGKL